MIAPSRLPELSGPSRAPNRHQPKPGNQMGGRLLRRGEGGWVDVGWTLVVARVLVEL